MLFVFISKDHKHENDIRKSYISSLTFPTQPSKETLASLKCQVRL